MRIALAIGAIIITFGLIAPPTSTFPMAQHRQVAAAHSYQIKFSHEKNDGKRAISTTVVQAKSTTDAQRQVKASYKKVNIITIKKL